MPGTETVGQTVGEQLGTLVHMLGTETVGQTVREQLGTLVKNIERLMFLSLPGTREASSHARYSRQLGYCTAI